MIVTLPSSQRHFGVFVVVLLSWHTAFGKHCKPKDCIDLKCYGVRTAPDGADIYTESTSFKKVKVTCDQKSAGGGWMVYLRRFDGSVPFSRPWAKYKSGFGKQGDKSESWLGNEIVYQLVNKCKDAKGKLRIEGALFNGSSCDIVADNFWLGDEANNYRMHFGKVTSNCGQLVAGNWVYHNDAVFATNDHEHDSFCFNDLGHNGGWWYKRCHQVYLTGIYPKKHNSGGGHESMSFHNFSNGYPLQHANILFRPMDITRSCDNPCAAGGTCEYLEATKSHRCVCPETHCGATCEKVNPCQHNGTCVYSAKTKKISCKCIGSHKGTHCDEGDGEAQPEAESYTFIAGASLLALICIAAIVIGAILINKKRIAEQEEKLTIEEADRQRLLQAEQERKEEEDAGFFVNFFG